MLTIKVIVHLAIPATIFEIFITSILDKLKIKIIIYSTQNPFNSSGRIRALSVYAQYPTIYLPFKCENGNGFWIIKIMECHFTIFKYLPDNKSLLTMTAFPSLVGDMIDDVLFPLRHTVKYSATVFT